MGDEAIEQTLFLAKEVQVYTIPPRPSSGGHKSGEWKVADRIFEGRLRVLSIGERCELRLEDPGRWISWTRLSANTRTLQKAGYIRFVLSCRHAAWHAGI